ncbi:MnhB domain-containing protein [Staphylococcus aureus]|uniref:MnhB domain-containing protein n=1 Tax=Staphylococcus aureus TaxID=1280 RepID=UPI00210D430B
MSDSLEIENKLNKIDRNINNIVSAIDKVKKLKGNSYAFILMFLAFNVEEVLESLPIDFRILMIIGALVSSITAIMPTFFGKPFLSQYETTLTLPILGHIHVTTITLFELGILFSVVGVIVTVMLSLSGGRS